jgi:hypothetical protein
MIKFLAFIHLGCFFTPVNGQGYGFADGKIVTKKGDTINCLVEMAVTYGEQVSYKTKQRNAISSMQVTDIRSIQTPYTYWESIQVRERMLLMGLVVDGKARLFNHVIINKGKEKKASSGNVQFYDPPTVTYVVQKGGIYTEVAEDDFKEKGTQLFKDCTILMEKISSDVYKLEEMEKVVKEYNECRLK